MIFGLDRWLGLGVPYARTGFATPFAESHFAPLRRNYFEGWARAHHALFRQGSRREGLVPRFEDLAWPGFRPDKVDPLIRTFYEHSNAFAVTVTSVDWNGPAARMAGRLYRGLLADPAGNLMPPLDEGPVHREMDCHIGLLDVDRDGAPDYRIWLRTFVDDDSLLYVAAVHAFRDKGHGYLTLAFPFPKLALTVVLECRNGEGDPSSFEMHTNAPRSPLAGTYAVFPDGQRVTYARLPGMHETFRFAVRRTGGVPIIDGEHSAEVGPFRIFTLRYELTPTAALADASYDTDRAAAE